MRAEDVEENGGMGMREGKGGEFDGFLVPLLWIEGRIARREKLRAAG